MLNSYNKKLITLSKWLATKSHLQEAFDVGFLKTAISKEEAEKILYSSKRVSKILKGILWEMDISYEPKDLDYLSKVYKGELTDLVPNDIEDKEKGLSIQWLSSLGSSDKSFAKQVILSAIKNDEAFMSNSLVGDFVNRIQKEGYSFESIGDRLGLRAKLERFFHWKNFMSEKDLMSIRSLDDLSKVITEAAPAIKSYQENKKYLDSEEGQEFLGEDKYWKVIVIHNKGAACDLGSDTDWCTAAPGLDYFAQYYHPDDPIFYIENKRKPEDIYQVHFGSGQFMDRRDMEVDPHMQDELIEVLQSFGADDYLGARLYSNYDTFFDGSYDEALFLEFAKDLREYEREVIGPKIMEDTYENVYGPFNKFIGTLKKQIIEGEIDLDDSALSDEAVALLAEYDPTGFFEEKLHIDYPDLAKEVFMKALYPKTNENLLTKEYNSLSKDILLNKDGALEEGDSLAQLVDNDPGVSQAYALSVLRSASPSDMFGAELRGVIEKEFPGFVDKFIQSAVNHEVHPDKVSFEYTETVKATSENNRIEYGLSERVKEGNRTTIRNIPTIMVSKKAIMPISYLIKHGFNLQHKRAFDRLFREFIRIELSQIGQRSFDKWSIISTLKLIHEGKMLPEYSEEFLEIYKAGIRSSEYEYIIAQLGDLTRFNLTNEVYEEMKALAESASDVFMKDLFLKVDNAYPNWRKEDISPIILADLNSENTRKIMASKNAFFVPLFREVEKLIIKATRPPWVSGTLTKPSMPEELLLFVATFMPNLWELQNLDYRASNVTDEMRSKAERALRAINSLAPETKEESVDNYESDLSEED